MRILTLNAGSSSLKFSVIETEGEQTVVRGSADWASVPTRYTFRAADSDTIRLDADWSDVTQAVRRVASDIRLTKIDDIATVAHRVVHGGTRFTKPVLITKEVEASLRELVPLAPLHNPCSLEGIAAARQAFSDLPHVAVFDTAFHATLAPEAYTYPVPYEWTEKWNVRRFGFHGLSHAYCASRAAEILKQPLSAPRLIVAHLGHGASLAAIRDGKSVETTMGFTPLEGLMMATRSGSIDPGLVLHVAREYRLAADELDRILNHQSGLLGVSRVSADMRKVEQAAESGNERASLAIAIYVHRLRQAIGAMAATLGGLDALVFTGGVGEHATTIRAATCDRLDFLGLELDPVANDVATADAIISAKESQARIIVITTNEELMLGREAMTVVVNSQEPPTSQ
ncbi:MAG: acetate kinase [Planctomycetota bacterium]|nr:MAG: acetate kinase [Planctomycetota bacterium]REJ92158.1 MAG: acetate kinase [Planctomycetota bacterium]REK28694.1 MAG: acetate kinase [Planctomycetota bacterium]REK39308.1 MAG: acetate kinase [Planctomycetota bacterium]